jgi:hypothetical protein
LARRHLKPEALHAFDLTPAMLAEFRRSMLRRPGLDVEIHEADVLELDTLPATWTGYDLIVTASMLEYVQRDRSHWLSLCYGRACVQTATCSPLSRNAIG